uniref:Secreted protein n=1 Tax=Heterorhabditis bacteriophora TaxID=37862 RepID=A0A1I7W991_HETBA
MVWGAFSGMGLSRMSNDFQVLASLSNKVMPQSTLRPSLIEMVVVLIISYLLRTWIQLPPCTNLVTYHHRRTCNKYLTFLRILYKIVSILKNN